MSKINILVINQDTHGGVGFYRSTQPHEQLEKQFPDLFHVSYESEPNFSQLSDFEMFDIIHFHRGIYEDDAAFLKFVDFCKQKGITLIMDIDDYWELSPHHPQYIGNNDKPKQEKIKRNLQLVDYVTTTTKLFADKIRPFNKNVIIFENAINPEDERFKINREPCDKLRIGMVMGSTHEHDLMTMDNFVSKLPKEITDKVIFTLCGFDIRGYIRMYDQNGNVKSRQIEPNETVWYRYEKMITDNYRIISPEYKQFLERFLPNVEYPSANEEGYRRCWTLDMDHYYQHYNYCDVLFAPLEENDFNKVKSPLKIAECCFAHTAFVGSNFGPYTLGTKEFFKKGGGYEEDGNVILIDKNRAHKDWCKTVEKLVKNPDYVKRLQDKIYEDFHERFDLRNVTKQRADFYQKIINERKNN